MNDWHNSEAARSTSYSRSLSAAAAAAAVGITSRDRKADVMNIGSRLLNNSNPEVRKDAIKSLARIGGSNATFFIAKKINDLDPYVRAVACEALGCMRAHCEKNLLYDALLDRKVCVRCAAANALSYMGDKHGLAHIAKLLKIKGVHQLECLRSFNTITRSKNPLNKKGIEDALRWIKRNDQYLTRL